MRRIVTVMASPLLALGLVLAVGFMAPASRPPAPSCAGK